MELLGMKIWPTWPEPTVEEQSGLVELPITGFVIRMRGDTCRLIGYIRRGTGGAAPVDPALILHMPRTGAAVSIRHAVQRWNADYETGRDRHWQ